MENTKIIIRQGNDQVCLGVVKMTENNELVFEVKRGRRYIQIPYSEARNLFPDINI